ncbi:DEAD/DEAH box helicase [Geomonas nitrogeniifigens]|uniref:DEAD/DEAH box helicase n=1 Tax=Geomonas diazotrophica TaxID=2843197 RepID=A0ABX8JIK9_9BACT|nr:DEAD/DEAH box helicase [Geomonas nitrogeniifigens]QWV97469.1 DEAD/DEAH box helicase [Geomonas nitrogeniifigens]
MQISLYSEPRQHYRPVPVVKPQTSHITLRSSQAAAIDGAREKVKQGVNKVAIVAPCGFGKSVLACAFIEAAKSRGSRIWFVVDRQILVNDMSDKLASYGIDHGVLMSGHWRWDTSKPVQVVSIQTAEKRGWATDIDVMIVDEAHANLRKSFLEFCRNSPKTKIIGLTATPFTKGMGAAYHAVINPTSTNKQIGEGYLVPLRIFQCVQADMTGAKVVAGEYSDSAVVERGRLIIGDIVSTWVEKTSDVFGGPVKTIVFTADIAHGIEVAAAFAAQGYDFRQISCKTSKEERDEIISEFRRPDSTIHGLISCGVLTRGFDVTDVQVGIMARPLRKSFSEFIQQVGRIQRSHPGKEFGLLLDHAGNVGRFLPEMEELFENGVSRLDDPADAKPPRKEPTKKELLDIFCPKCGAMWAKGQRECLCGYVRQPKKSAVEVVPGKMVEVTLNGKTLAKTRYNLYQQLCTITRERSHNPGWAAHKYHEIVGNWPKWRFDETPSVEVSRETRNKVRQMQIAFSKRALS